jgi:hypothetical protein
LIGKVEGKRTLWRPRLMGGNITVRTALFGVITLRVVVTSYRHFGTTYRPHLQWILDPWRWDR